MKTLHLNRKPFRLSELWQLRHGPLNLIKVVELLIEPPLALPHDLLCLIASLISDWREGKKGQEQSEESREDVN